MFITFIIVLFNEYAFDEAMENGYDDIVYLLLSSNIDVNFASILNLNFKLHSKYFLFLNEGVITLYLNKTPLYIAVENNDKDLFHLLLKNKNINVNKGSDEPPLFVAVINGNKEFVELLLENENIDINLEFI